MTHGTFPRLKINIHARFLTNLPLGCQRCVWGWRAQAVEVVTPNTQAVVVLVCSTAAQVLQA